MKFVQLDLGDMRSWTVTVKAELGIADSLVPRISSTFHAGLEQVLSVGLAVERAQHDLQLLDVGRQRWVVVEAKQFHNRASSALPRGHGHDEALVWHSGRTPLTSGPDTAAQPSSFERFRLCGPMGAGGFLLASMAAQSGLPTAGREDLSAARQRTQRWIRREAERLVAHRYAASRRVARRLLATLRAALNGARHPGSASVPAECRAAEQFHMPLVGTLTRTAPPAYA